MGWNRGPGGARCHFLILQRTHRLTGSARLFGAHGGSSGPGAGVQGGCCRKDPGASRALFCIPAPRDSPPQPLLDLGLSGSLESPAELQPKPQPRGSSTFSPDLEPTCAVGIDLSSLKQAFIEHLLCTMQMSVDKKDSSAAIIFGYPRNPEFSGKDTH